MTPGPEDDVSQAEKRAVLRNDAAVRANANRNGNTGTYLSHTHIDDAGGRFAQVNAATIVGQTPVPKYPAASAAHQTELPPEGPLGYPIDRMPSDEPSAVSVTAVEQPGAPVGAVASPSQLVAPPSRDDGEPDDAGAPPFTPEERR
jgi:hypothetical protein